MEHGEPAKEWTNPIGKGGKGLVVLTPGEGEDGMGACLLECVKAVEGGIEGFLEKGRVEREG